MYDAERDLLAIAKFLVVSRVEQLLTNNVFDLRQTYSM